MSEIMKKAAILGVTGYTGAEALRLIQAHPRLQLGPVTGHSRAGEKLSTLYPHVSGLGDIDILTTDEVDWQDVDVAFACLPHGASQETIAQIADKVETIIDLSADFRLKSAELYAKTYGRAHNFPDLLSRAVYGLTEYARDDLVGASLIACPGCYPTCSLLTLMPALKAGLAEVDSIIIDAKSGVTGAGRKASDNLIYSQVADGAHAYGVGVHRHGPEIDQFVEGLTGQSPNISFTPHLIPMNRGMIATIYIQLAAGSTMTELRQAYVDRYANEAFVTVLPDGQVPETRHVRGSNECRIGLFEDRVPGRAILIGVIDNLTKGSSGQAVQNYNVAQGWDETLGLTGLALFP